MPAICLLLFLTVSCTSALFRISWTEERAPRKFKARFETTHGSFDIEAQREWSPAGVDRLYQLIKHGFYEDMAIYKAVPGVVEFGISNDTLMNYAWRAVPIKDEPVIESNLYGTIFFIQNGEKGRTPQIIINTTDNTQFDKKGYTVVAKITSGMNRVTKFFGEYGESPSSELDSIYRQGNIYLQKNFPELDYIQKSYLLFDEY